jgi:hypothetical protein
MLTRHLAAATLGAFLFATAGAAQSAVDLLQKGIHAQETAGDVDGAIKIFRQVTGAPSNNRLIAAQAQYQLVLCMLQKGDRAAASQEVDLLARNFSEQADLIAKARKLLPGGNALLPAPWGESELLQLNIKRDGRETGERLFYSVDPQVQPSNFQPQQPPSPQNQILRWDLVTKNSRRMVATYVDRSTMQPVPDRPNARIRPWLESDDPLGDPSVTAFAGPAIDVQQSVFLMRRMPLTPGYKTTLTSLAFALGQYAPKQIELAVTGVDTIQTPAGRFKCYTVSASGVDQTFWIGMEGTRPLARFRAGSVEAELVKVWGPENALNAVLAFVTATGGKIDWRTMGPGPAGTAQIGWEGSVGAQVWLKRIHVQADEIPQSLRRTMAEQIPGDGKLRPESVQTRVIHGQQALSAIVDMPTTTGGLQPTYRVWIQTENCVVEFNMSGGPEKRWYLDQLLEHVRIP